jgi:hypothetical protein
MWRKGPARGAHSLEGGEVEFIVQTAAILLRDDLATDSMGGCLDESQLIVKGRGIYVDGSLLKNRM